MREQDNRETSNILQALEIAKADLRANYDRLGVRAGPRNHHEYWARDGFFASLGANVLGDFEIVRKNLDLFIRFQKSDGQIPLRIEDRNHALFVTTGINLPGPLSPKFKSSQLLASEAVDPTPLFIIAASHYLKASKDSKWLKSNHESMKKASDWILSKRNGLGLVEEGLVASWADMTLRNGALTYTNVLAWKALNLMGRQKEANNLKMAINRNLWDEKRGFYIDFIDRKEKVHTDFFSDGNMLAVALGLTTPEQSKKIYDYVEANSLNTIPVATYQKNGTAKRKLDIGDLYTRVLFPHYHTNNIFGWWGPWEIIGRVKRRDIEGARKDLRALSRLIINNGSTFEVADRAGKPIDTPLYKSERSPAWAAGMFVYAADMVSRNS